MIGRPYSQFVKDPISNKRIVLFNPKSDSNSYFEGVPTSLLSISRFLYEEGGYDIRIISASSEEDYFQTILQLSDGAMCFGVTSMTGYQIHDGLRAAKAVREKYPDIPIVWGGWHPSICSVQTVSNPYVDIVVRGQGERTFTELVHKLENNSPLDDVMGITYKKNGMVHENPDRPFEDINSFPPLPYRLVEMGKYVRVSEYGSRTVDYISSQGCPYRCAFCPERKVNKGRWSGLSPQRVVECLKFLVTTYNINAVYVHDGNFFLDEERVRDICKGIIENKLVLKWGQANGCTKQLVRYREDTWCLMRESGCVSILVGAESGSQQVLDFICKDVSVKNTVKLAQICKSHGIGLVFSLMLGFPHAPGKFDQSINEEFEQTVLLIDKVQAMGVDLNICGWFVYTPYPGTPLYNLSIQRGWEEPQTLEGWARFGLSGKNTPWIPRKYANLLGHFGRYIFPCVGTTYINAWRNKQHAGDHPRLHIMLAILILKVLHRTASFRWKHKFFFFPIEDWLIKLYKKLT